jgi:hypothetical protein
MYATARCSDPGTPVSARAFANAPPAFMVNGRRRWATSGHLPFLEFCIRRSRSDANSAHIQSVLAIPGVVERVVQSNTGGGGFE